MNDLISEQTHPLVYTKYGQIIWTEREDQRLGNSYRKIPQENILKLFPDRTWIAIQSRASIIKIPRKGRHYTNEEDSRLLTLYYHTDLTYKQMSQYFTARSGDCLRSRMCNIRKKNKGSDS